jgi:hypothetical protein
MARRHWGLGYTCVRRVPHTSTATSVTAIAVPAAFILLLLLLLLLLPGGKVLPLLKPSAFPLERLHQRELLPWSDIHLKNKIGASVSLRLALKMSRTAFPRPKPVNCRVFFCCCCCRTTDLNARSPIFPPCPLPLARKNPTEITKKLDLTRFRSADRDANPEAPCPEKKRTPKNNTEKGEITRQVRYTFHKINRAKGGMQKLATLNQT